MSSQEEETALSEQAANLEKQLEQVKARLAELRQGKKEKKT
jgi:hypothetical protein